MVYLREFCQNARDAGASMVQVTFQDLQNHTKIIFDDNGRGMSFDHAKSYLFTLYASSKEQESDSAGRFGVGFWSVLLSNPVSITVSSMTKNAPPWKIRMDGDLKSLHQERPTLSRTGTRIVVTYRTNTETEKTHLEVDAKSALVRYCKYLRRNDKARSPLPVQFNGDRIDRPFSLDSPCWMTFTGKHIEGAVGLTETPGVEIYAQGLPVWQGTVIDELKYGAKRQTPVHLPKGLSPHYLINGHNLNVTYDRRAIVDDRALRILRREARLKMDELLKRYLDQVSPRPLITRLWDQTQTGLKSVFAEYPVSIVGIFLLVLAALTFRFFPTNSGGGAMSGARVILDTSEQGRTVAVVGRRALGNPMLYTGPTTELPRGGAGLSLVYTPKTDQAFRIAAMEMLDDTAGIVAGPMKIVGPHPPFECTSACMDIAVALDAERGKVILPVPSGHAVSPTSVRLDNRSYPLLVSAKGEPVIQLPRRTKGTLTYRAGPIRVPLAPSRRAALLQLPEGAQTPTAFATAVSRVRLLSSREQQLREAMRFIETRIAYDTSKAVSEQYSLYQQRKRPKYWMPFVFTLGKGDCDVKNALLVHLLRSVGIPARLAVGPIGEQGTVIPLMHAWVEYFNNTWHVADATGGAAGRTDAIDPTPETETAQTAPDTEAPEIAATGEAIATRAPSALPIAHGREPVAPAAASSPVTFSRRQISGIVFGAAMLAGLLLALSTLLASGRNGQMVTPSGATQKEEVAAKIAAGALAFPEWWHLGDGLKRRPILPCIGGGRSLSIRDAERLAERGALFVAHEKTTWLAVAAKAKAKVIDGNSTIFKQVASLLPSITHLDEIDTLAPKPPAAFREKAPNAATLAEAVNGIIRESGVRDVALFLSETATPDKIREVNVAPLGKKPGHLVVVAVTHPLFEDADDGEPTPLGIYKRVDALVSQSDFLSHHTERLLRTAAQRIWGAPA